MIGLNEFSDIVSELRARGFADDDIAWSEGCGPPKDADDFASEAVFVICNSGMKNTVARRIFERCMTALRTKSPVSAVFGHKGKSAAIECIWIRRERYFAEYMAALDKVEFCGSLPWIGNITKYHLAKTFGAQVAKPDVHLQRLADREGCSPQALCERLSKESGYSVPTVDVLLWRACAIGVINSRSPAQDN